MVLNSRYRKRTGLFCSISGVAELKLEYKYRSRRKIYGISMRRKNRNLGMFEASEREQRRGKNPYLPKQRSKFTTQ